jgi:predicted dehydrogenase
VTICSPSGAHLEPALLAAQAGKHVIVEKPLEVTLKRCDQIIEVCERHRVQLATIFPSRFHGCWRELKSAIDQGRFGTLALGNAYIKWFRTQSYYDSGKWRGTWKLDGGGALMNQAIHTIDLLQWLMGPIRSVSALTSTLAHSRIEVEDVAVAALEFVSGALGTIEATTASFPGLPKRIEIHGNSGSAVIEEEAIRHWRFHKSLSRDKKRMEQFSARSESSGGASSATDIGHHGHRELFRDFVKAMRENGTPAVDGHEGRKSVEIILAIYEASKRGKKVTLTR